MNSLKLIIDLFPTWLIVLYIFLFGLCIGSFLNVVILRGLNGGNIVLGRSKCPKCNNQLKWYMNIPVFSYIFLRGKCAFCSCKISPQYPIVELITALLFLGVYFTFGLSFKALFLCSFLSLFITMSTTDILQTVIIDTHAYILLILGLIYSALNLGEISLLWSIVGSIFGFLAFELMAKIGKIFCGCRMFGEGDSLIALGLGAIFGWKNLIIIIVLSVLIQSISTVPMLIKQSFAQEKNKLGISYSIVILSILLIFLTNQFNLIDNQLSHIGFVIIITSGLLWSLKNILDEIKLKKEDTSQDVEQKFCLLPFGPALLISATICIFYLEQIKEYILNYIG